MNRSNKAFQGRQYGDYNRRSPAMETVSKMNIQMENPRNIKYKYETPYKNQKSAEISDSCIGCNGLPQAMAYVPDQCWRNLFEIPTGFRRGTIFRELDKPFYVTPCAKEEDRYGK